jgi:hypothetical protein
VVGVSGLHNASLPDDKTDFWDRMIRCAYEEETKYQWNSLGEEQVYALDYTKPCTQTLASDDGPIPDWAVRLFSTPIEEYKRLASSQRVDNELAPETEKELEALGYL